MVKFLSFTALSVIIVSADCHNWTITGTPGTAGTAGTRFCLFNFAISKFTAAVILRNYRLRVMIFQSSYLYV